MSGGRSASVLGVIPARGGSKGIADKNVRELGGKPLIAYSIEAALGARSIGRVIVSTDNPGIAALAREHGVEVPFMRPPELAEDDAPMLPVLTHAITWMNDAGGSFDTVVCLQPTSPMRTAEHIDEAVRLFGERSCAALASVCPVRESPQWMVKVEDGTGTPFIEGGWENHSRQLLPALYRLNGAIYVYSLATMTGRWSLPRSICVYEMDELSSIDIDSEADLVMAEALLRRDG